MKPLLLYLILPFSNDEVNYYLNNNLKLLKGIGSISLLYNKRVY